MGEAVYGPSGCTCWVEVLAPEQQQPIGAPGMEERSEMCHDCAYRPGSPERSGEKDYANNSLDDLLELAQEDRPFVCHQGMVKVVALEHPSGVRLDQEQDDFRPPVLFGVQYKADGTAADVCAGWAARRRLYLKEISELSNDQ